MNSTMERQPCVYGLRAGSVYGYVGKTSVNPTTRLWEHISRARSGHSAPVYAWMREVGIENVTVDILSEEDDLSQEEVRWIVKLRADGHPLHNQLGIDGNPNSWSPEMREKVGNANRGKDTWTKGKRGEAAGWTPERRAAQSARIAAINAARRGA